MSNFITVGGPPGSGKSTLIKNLLLKHDFSYVSDHIIKQMIDCKRRSHTRTNLGHKICLDILNILTENNRNILFEVPPNFIDFFPQANNLLNKSRYKYHHFLLESDLKICIERKTRSPPMGGKYWSTTSDIVKEYYFLTKEIYKNINPIRINTNNLSKRQVLNKVELHLKQKREILVPLESNKNHRKG